MPKIHLRDLHEQAFQLYLQSRSFEQIGSELKVAKSTIERWSKGNPERKETAWLERASAIRSKAATVTDKRAADQIAKLCNDLETLRTDILEEVKNTHFKSKEGAVASIRSLTDLLTKLGPRQQLTNDDLTRVWEVLLSDPDVGPELRKTHVADRLIKKIDQLLAHA
jgi:transposase